MADKAAELRSQLADRDRRLAELTSQCLQILDQYERLRAANGNSEALQQRVAHLEEVLAETRSRVRLAGSIQLTPQTARPAGAVHVVIWGVDAAGAARLPAMLAAAGELPVTVLLGGQGATAALPPLGGHRAAVQSIATTFAATCNEAMAVSQGEVVVCWWAGSDVDGDGLQQLVGAVIDGVALAGAAVASGDRIDIGAAAAAPFEPEPQPLHDGDQHVRQVEYPLPELFAVSRSAFHRTGPFDGDMRTVLALAEWCERARAQQLRVLGVPAAVARCRAGDLGSVAPPAAVLLEDRLIATARHRPGELMRYALHMEEVWALEPGDVLATLRAAFQRLPGLAALPAVVEMLLQHARSLLDAGIDPGALLRRLRLIEARLLDGSEMPPEATASERDAISAAVSRLTGLAGTLVDQCHARDLELQEARATIEALRRDLAENIATVSALKDTTIDLNGQIGSFKERLIAREGVIGDVRADLARVQTGAEQLSRDLAQRDHALAELNRELEAAQARSAGLQREREDLAAELGAFEQAVAAERECVARMSAELDQVNAARENLHSQRDTLQSASRQLEQQVHDCLVRLREADARIAGLLREVTQRRLFPRQLTEDERRFLEPGSGGA